MSVFQHCFLLTSFTFEQPALPREGGALDRCHCGCLRDGQQGSWPLSSSSLGRTPGLGGGMRAILTLQGREWRSGLSAAARCGF